MEAEEVRRVRPRLEPYPPSLTAAQIRSTPTQIDRRKQIPLQVLRQPGQEITSLKQSRLRTQTATPTALYQRSAEMIYYRKTLSSSGPKLTAVHELGLLLQLFEICLYNEIA